MVPDVADAINMLKRGEVDFCTQDIPCDRYDELVSHPGIRLTGARGNALGNLTFNFARAPWSDIRVRRAIAMMIDREAMASEVCSQARPAPYAYLEHVDWAFNPTARYDDYDPRTAESLLDEAGLTLQELTVTDLPPGVYTWRVMSRTFAGGGYYEKWTPPERFEIGR